MGASQPSLPRTKPVRAVERAISILFLVTRSDGPLTLTEIARAAALDKATALRLLHTLEIAQLVRRDPRTRRYGPGINVWRLPKSWRNDLREVSRPHLESLWRATQETVTLACLRGLERVVIEVLPAPHELCVVPTVGTTQPIHTGAAGKVILAHMPPAERDHVIEVTGLKPVVPGTFEPPAAFVADLEKVRADGYAYCVGKVAVGVVGLAAPVFDATGGVVATLTVRGPEVRMPAERAHQIAPLLVAAARDISWDLGHHRDPPRAV